MITTAFIFTFAALVLALVAVLAVKVNNSFKTVTGRRMRWLTSQENLKSHVRSHIVSASVAGMLLVGAVVAVSALNVGSMAAAGLIGVCALITVERYGRLIWILGRVASIKEQDRNERNLAA